MKYDFDAAMASSKIMLDKRERVEQLRRLGFNVPRMLRIPAGTTLDETWLRRMEAVRQGDQLVTVRSYHPTDELHQTDLPRLLGGTVPEALQLVQQLVPLLNVLWQEAVPIKGTLYCGNVIVEPDGSGDVEAARGEYEVRAVNELRVDERDRVTLHFRSDAAFGTPDLDHLVEECRRAARLLRQEGGVVIEFNIQDSPVGELRDRLVFWEWRPVVVRRRTERKRAFPAVRRFTELLRFGDSEVVEPVDPQIVGAIGAKASHLLRMAGAGLPVPAGFVIPITVCNEIASTGVVPPRVRDAFQELRQRSGVGVAASSPVPLLWSVRSSPTVSLPGLLHTVLNVGVDAESLGCMSRWTFETQKAIVAEYLLSYASASRVLNESQVERILSGALGDQYTVFGVTRIWRTALRQYGLAIPVTLQEQIDAAIVAVVQSAAEVFANKTSMTGAATAVIVQRMVFGNADLSSGTGVMHTRHPLVPSAEPAIEFLSVAQGPDLVSGRRTPLDTISIPGRDELLAALIDSGRKLEQTFRDMQEIEFTVQSGELWLLQSRRGERSPLAAVEIAFDLLREHVVDEAGARAMLADLDLRSLLPEVVDTSLAPIARGRGASPGAAAGRVVTPETATRSGDEILFVRRVDDAPQLIDAIGGIVSLQGGTTSHGAVLARSYDVPVVVAVTDSDMTADGFVVGEHCVRIGDWVTIDGTRGLIFLGVQEITRGLPDSLPTNTLEWFLSLPLAKEVAAQAQFEWG